jgi:hypothetical protein
MYADDKLQHNTTAPSKCQTPPIQEHHDDYYLRGDEQTLPLNKLPFPDDLLDEYTGSEYGVDSDYGAIPNTFNCSIIQNKEKHDCGLPQRPDFTTTFPYIQLLNYCKLSS